MSTALCDVVEVVDRARRAPPIEDRRSPPSRTRRRTPMNGTSSIPQAGSSPKSIATSSGASRRRPRAAPIHSDLGGDELLDVDRRGQDRVVGALEPILDERRRTSPRTPTRTAPRSPPSRCRRTPRTRSPPTVGDERAEAEAEREQVDRRLDDRRERRRAPVDEKLMTSRISTPVIAGGSRRRSRRRRRRLSRPTRSFDLLAGQQHEHVLEVGRRARSPSGSVAVGASARRIATARARCGASRCRPLGAPRLDLGEPRRRSVDLDAPRGPRARARARAGGPSATDAARAP